MQREVQVLSSVQVMALCSTSFLALTFWIFPRTAVEYAGLDAQWAVLGVILVGLVNAFVLGLLNDQYPNATIEDMFTMAWGKFLGKLSAIAILPGYLLFVALCLYFFVQVVIPYLPTTPTSLIIITLSVVSLYGAYQGVESLSRVSVLTIPPTILGILLTAWFVIGHQIMTGVRPTITHTVAKWAELGSGVYHLFPLFLGFNLTTMFSPHYAHARNRSVWYPVASALLAGVTIASMYLCVIWPFGWEMTRQTTFPVSLAISTLRLQGFLIERTGISVIILATIFTILFVGNHVWGLSVLTGRMFGLNPRYYRRMTYPVMAFITLVTIFIRTQDIAFQLLNEYMVPFSWFALLSITATLVVGKFRSKTRRRRA